MISAAGGSGRDARKGLGLGLGLGLEVKEMVESELEEGEACSYQNHEDYDATVDPDVALSYIVRVFFTFDFCLHWFFVVCFYCF